MCATKTDKRKARTVEKALSVLAEFGKGPPIIGVQALSARTGFPPAVVQRLVNSLRAASFLEQNESNKKYRLGVRVLELGAAAARYSSLLSAAKPVMQELSISTLELVFLEVVDRRNWRASYIHFLDPLKGRPLRLVQHSYLHAGAAGKVLLAYLPAQEVDHILAEIGLPKLTPKTITNARLLRDELATIRRTGYAVSHGEVVTNTSGVAAPVRDSRGEVVATLSVSGHDSRLTEVRMRKLRELVVAGAARISETLRVPGAAALVEQSSNGRSRPVSRREIVRGRP